MPIYRGCQLLTRVQPARGRATLLAQLLAQSCCWAVGPQVELGPTWLPDREGSPALSLWVEHRHRSAREGEGPRGGRTAQPRASSGPGGRVPALAVLGCRTWAQARLPPVSISGPLRGAGRAADSIPEPPEERPQVQMLLQQGGACCLCSRGRGGGRGVGLCSPAVWAPLPAQPPSATRRHWG